MHQTEKKVLNDVQVLLERAYRHETDTDVRLEYRKLIIQYEIVVDALYNRRNS